ncbi:hypothetical protein [Spongiactinospora sp. 9N601]|uniref:hypothetical protein n=1 Tax=Spongiactinospora sp. 9N601 TaxID=3375149 RepID=UPI0037BA46FF
MAHRFRTRDGHSVGVGDRVWSQNHWPWVIVSVDTRKEGRWANMEHTEVEFDTLHMFEADFGTYIYKFHPPEGCREAGCAHRPWGAR